jgi:hypothetical protein
MEMKITQPMFGILVALMKKRTYQNDMKSTYVCHLVFNLETIGGS